MSIQELRDLFMEEHKRDKKYTILNFILITTLILIIIGFLFYIGANFKETLGGLFGGGENSGESAWWLKLVFPIILIVLICYPFYRLWKLSKRPSEIEDLLSRIEGGAKASNVTDYIDHKISIPLGKVTIKLVPVNFAMIYLDVDVKSYQLPVRKIYMADIKLLLSGANMEKLSEIRNALYGDDDNADENYVASKVVGGDSETVTSKPQEVVMTPIKPIEEFRTFLDTELKGTLEGLEQSRKSTRSQFLIWGVLAFAIMGGLVYYMYSSTMTAQADGDYSGGGSYKVILIFFAVIVIGSFIYSKIMRSKYQTTSKGGIVGMENATHGAAGGDEFKQKVFKRMIDFVNPTVEYAPIGHIGLPEFLESGLFEKKSYDMNGSDQIMGRHNGVPFIMCDLQVTYQANFSNEKDGPDSVFVGQYFVARFNKKFTSPVFIKAKTGVKGLLTDNDINGYLTNVGSKVVLEDPEFMKMFEVYSTDQIEARYILTPSLMERIKELAKRTKGKYYIAFTNNKITVANNSQNDNFEMGMGLNKSYTKNDNELIINFYKDLTDQFSLVDELRLNIKIWG